MSDNNERAVAIVGIAAIMPDAPDADTFWRNIVDGRYSISDVPHERWDPALYYDPDPAVPDKTYSKIGGWVREFEWNPLGWRLPVPPRVSDAMDDGQKWAVSLARSALRDYGWPRRPLDQERTAVVVGTAIGGERHYRTSLRIYFPEFARELEASAAFAALPKKVRAAILDETRSGLGTRIPVITEDSMPGELPNVMAGRIANLFDFHGPSYTTDAACASGLAAMASSVEGLVTHQYDAVVTGGVDRNMGANSFVKFCKIGALSATGTRPYATGADGFVMGEGGTMFVLKRLADAERDGDRIYAVLLGIAGSSDGKGKGITAPNPLGQRLAVERAWHLAGVAPSACSLVEGHGTSTAVGDVVEVGALAEVFGGNGRIPLGSVKSNIGHLKAAAGTAGLFKAAKALHHKVLPATLHAEEPNQAIDFAHSPFRLNTETREWDPPAAGVRLAGVSAFGFGGTNFHAVLEEHVPGRRRMGPAVFAGVDLPSRSTVVSERESTISGPPCGGPTAHALAAAHYAGHGTPVEARSGGRGAFVAGAQDTAGLIARLNAAAPVAGPPSAADLAAPERVAIDYGDADELASKALRAVQALERGDPALRRALRAQGVFFGHGPRAKVAFLYPGQGSQYVGMLDVLRRTEPVVAETLAEADRVMTPLLHRPLTDYMFSAEPDAEQRLLRTEITQPAVLAVDIALTRLLATHGITPDLAMGHSLGEYGALVAAGALPFDQALAAVSARGNEMAHLSVADNGAMAAVLAPLPEIERIVAATDGYVVIANVNSTGQAVIGGATTAVEAAVAAFAAAGHTAIRLPVSHAFHTAVVAPASEPLGRVLRGLDLRAPTLPVVANVDGQLYPTGRAEMIDVLVRQIASPVQFVTGLCTLYARGAHVFVEVGPKKALHGFVEDVLGREHDEVVALFTNHPKQGDVVSFNQALCGLYAAGHGTPAPQAQTQAPAPAPAEDRYRELGHLLADFLERGQAVLAGAAAPTPPRPAADTEPVTITGAAVGLPGTERVFDDANVARILAGQQFIAPIPDRFRAEMADRHVTRLVKSEDGAHRFEPIDGAADVIKLAARAGRLDLVADFGLDDERDKALDECTRLAIGAGLDALRDAGIPLVHRYRTTTVGTRLATTWGLPDALRDDTGVIFASAFPGYAEFAKDLERYFADRFRRRELAALSEVDGTGVARRIAQLEAELAAEPFEFDRRFIFRVLSMGHSQFAELIGARGPNTQVNAACASTTQAVTIAEDWIRAGRCRRVVVIAADDVTADTLLPWVGAGFLASGAAATDAAVEDAALPFDRRRHGMLLGMGAAGIVVESAEAARERGIRPICEVLAGVTANSAYHGTRLDTEHVSAMMERLLTQAERRGVRRDEIANELVFVSHETYTPARGGSAQAEIDALRSVFASSADRIVIANTKGFTGHPMGVGIEDVVAVKALETGVVPPVPNFKEVDPSLGSLRLSTGGTYPVRYALRLAAGFGSQISMVLLRWTPVPDGRHRAPEELGYEYRIVDRPTWQRWLAAMTGTGDARLEVVQRRLRVVDDDAPKPAVPAPEPVPVAEDAVAEDAVAEDAVAEDAVADQVLAVVAEKTGYPADVLEPDLDLEADLGIDTVKQAEVFAQIRETFDIPRDDTLKLRDYPTLAHVIAFVRERTGEPAEAAAAEEAEAEEAEAEEAEAEEAEAVTVVELPDTDGFPRRVPVATIRPPLDLCLPTGVELGSGVRVVVAGDRGGVAAALTERLRERGVEVLDTPDGRVDGVYWLPALDDEGPVEEMDLPGWREANRIRVKRLYATMREVYDTVGFLVTATRLGGRHGYDEHGATAPLGGAVTGFAKAFARERTEALVKAVDVGPGATPDEVADWLVAETRADPGAVEVGHADGLRWTVTLEERPAAGTGLELNQDTVFVVTGAAGGIVSAITADLAKASGGTFHLLDLTPEPDPADADVRRFTEDRDGLKADLIERLRAAGERGIPVLVERELTRLERLAAAQAAIEAVQEAGGQVYYHSVDLTDGDAVARALAGVDHVDVLVHAAGLDMSHPLPAKEPREYDLVFDVKADGWFNVVKAVGEIGATVSFCSVAGRFGNVGQTDYAAANDLLAKLASASTTRAIAIDWTAWAGIGMATRGSVPTFMAQAGVELLPPAIGVPAVRRELTAGTWGEVVVAGRLGVMVEERPGVDPAAFGGTGPMVGRVVDLGVHSGLIVETTIDPAEQPFLHDHRIDGTPVLPGVMGIEAFTEVAALPLPGWRPVEVCDVEFLAPCKFYRDEPRTVTVTATYRRDGADLVAHCRLTASRQLPGQPDPQVTTHFTGDVRLARTPVAEVVTDAAPAGAGAGAGVAAADIYGVYFHGPAFQVLDRAWRGEHDLIGLYAAGLPADHVPADRPEAAQPRLIELVFQTAGVWEIGHDGRFGLPRHVDRIVLHDTLGDEHGRVAARVTTGDAGFGGQVVDENGAVLLELSGYRTVELPGGVDPDRGAPLAAAMAGSTP